MSHTDVDGKAVWRFHGEVVAMSVEDLAELLHDRYCQGGRCSRLDRRGCWAWTSGRWHVQARELLDALATGHRVRLRPAGRGRIEKGSWAA